MTREVRENLNNLSKQCFGTSSRWQKIINKGVAEPHERDREVTIPDGRGGVKTKIFTDKKSIVRHHSVEEVKKLMEDILAARKGQVVQEVTSSAPSVQVIDTDKLVDSHFFPSGATITDGIVTE